MQGIIITFENDSKTNKWGLGIMSKRIIAVFMLASMLFSLAACNGRGLIPAKESTATTTTVVETSAPETTESESETTTEETEETTEETSSEETTEETTTSETTTETTAKPATPTPKPIGKTKVLNAYSRTFSVKNYGKFTTKYPKVTIKGVSTSAINKEIAKKFGSIAKKNEGVIKYSYYIGKKYVSILITVNPEAGKEGSNYYVYNVSRVTGKKLSKSEMLKMIGLSSSSFNTKVKSGVKKWWNNNILKNDKSSATKKQYNAALGSKSINSAVPFVNSKGKKCFLLRNMKAPTQFVTNDIHMTI